MKLLWPCKLGVSRNQTQQALWVSVGLSSLTGPSTSSTRPHWRRHQRRRRSAHRPLQVWWLELLYLLFWYQHVSSFGVASGEIVRRSVPIPSGARLRDLISGSHHSLSAAERSWPHRCRLSSFVTTLLLWKNILRTAHLMRWPRLRCLESHPLSPPLHKSDTTSSPNINHPGPHTNKSGALSLRRRSSRLFMSQKRSTSNLNRPSTFPCRRRKVSRRRDR